MCSRVRVPAKKELAVLRLGRPVTSIVVEHVTMFRTLRNMFFFQILQTHFNFDN